MSERTFESSLKCRCVEHASPGTLPRISKFFIPEAKPHYAPDRLVDIEHIKLELHVDLPLKTLKGKCTTRFRGVASTVGRLTFDAIDLVVEKIEDGSGNELKFDRNDGKLNIFLKKAISSEEQSEVAIHYYVTEPRAGLYFIAPDEDYPNRPMQLWTQGQDQDNRYWIPCHDSPNEKASSEMIVTVDERYRAISNGILVEEKHDEKLKTKTFHWNQKIPHASYLITLCVGEFTEIKDSWKKTNGEEIPVRYYSVPGRDSETKLSFGKTPKMLDFFSKKIGVDYPYDKYDQVVAWDFIYGGMENTSSTTQTEYTLHPDSVELDYSSDPLVAHELAHQWFGDLLTCKEWSHAWLNEGFATYFESLWTEEEYGQDEFLYELYGYEQTYKAEDKGAYRRPIVTNVYMSPSDIFDRHLYEKGGRVLHMLRNLVGDVMWWKAINHYVNKHFGLTVETIDLQRAFEDVTGRSLSWFFDQWVFKAGHPQIKASYEWNEERKLVKISLVQSQKMDDLIGLFKLPMKIKVVTSEGEFFHELDLSGAELTASFPYSEKPKFVSINPENVILCDLEYKPGTENLIAQLKLDNDVMGRVFAAKSLAKDHSRLSVDALGEQLVREKFRGVQAAICDSLADIGTERAMDYLVKNWDSIKHPKARKNAIRAIGRFKKDSTVEILLKALKSENSPLCQYEAALAIGKTRLPGVYEKLIAALGKRDSWHDYYDRGILAGLAELIFDERVLGVLMKYTKSGLSMFTRREAVALLAHWGKSKPNLILESLVEFTRDPNFFVRLSALDALSELSDVRAAGALQRVTDTVVDPRTKRSALMALKSVREGYTATADVEKLQAELDRTREQFKELLSRVEKLEIKG